MSESYGVKPYIIDPSSTDISQCVERTQKLLASVRLATADYFNSTPLLEIGDTFERDSTELSWSVPIHLETIGVVAAMVQASLALRGATDRGKTALAERLLTGLFGARGKDWWRIEMNRGMSIDDLVDIDGRKLAEAKLSEAIEVPKWLSKPGRLLDEINRVHPKLANLALHLADGSGFNIRGDRNIPIGLPYHVGDDEKRYSFTVTTANHLTKEYSGTYEEDQAMVRRIVVSVDLDELPPTTRDRVRMLGARRAKAAIHAGAPCTRQLVELYEALPEVVPYSALAYLLLHCLVGRQTCVRTRSGQLKPELKPGICEKCHLAKAHRFCGRVGGLSEGLLLWVYEVAIAIAVVRAAIVLDRVHSACCGSRRSSLQIAKLQKLMKTEATGESLHETFRSSYLSQLRVTAEDVKASYVLVGPYHVWIDPEWLEGQSVYEGNQFYVLKDVAENGWNSMVRFLRDHRGLVSSLARNGEVSPAEQSAVETYVTNQDAAMLSVINALRDEELPLHFRREMQEHRVSRVA